jgi:UDP-N-acetylglucosamine 2-epimerase (non-hydrolysing)
MTAKRRICIVTGSRAEYGHMRWLAQGLRDDARTTLQMLVTGTHLDPRHGETWREIAQDGFAIDARAAVPLDGDTPLHIVSAMGRATEEIGRALDGLKPDLVVILGDRYEMLAAASAALVLRRPIAHLHGGELTEGAFDDSIRHAITKMSHLHFAAAESYASRIVQLGEDPDHVFCVGAPGLDALAHDPALSREALAETVEFPWHKRFALVTYHPETLADDGPATAVRALCVALAHTPDLAALITGVNADPERDVVAAALSAFADQEPASRRIVASLGQRRYLSAMHHAAVVVGNSSSGLIEAPAVGTPTVNIGGRQAGRLRAASVIDCATEEKAIAAAIRDALDPAFGTAAKTQSPPYGRGGASRAICEILATYPLDGLIRKRFHDQEAA